MRQSLQENIVDIHISTRLCAQAREALTFDFEAANVEIKNSSTRRSNDSWDVKGC